MGNVTKLCNQIRKQETGAWGTQHSTVYASWVLVPQCASIWHLLSPQRKPGPLQEGKKVQMVVLPTMG
jgi:hypothetical protein